MAFLRFDDTTSCVMDVLTMSNIAGMTETQFSFMRHVGMRSCSHDFDGVCHSILSSCSAVISSNAVNL